MRAVAVWAKGRSGQILLLGLGCLLLQQIAIPYRLVLLGVDEPAASLVHLHVGAMLLIAMAQPDRRIVAGVFVITTAGWLARAWSMNYDTPLLLTGIVVAVLHYGWALLCAHWMGWPRAANQQRIDRDELATLALITLLAFPAGAALIGVVITLPYADLSRQLNWLLQSFLAKQFGVTVLTLPLLVAWCEWHHPAPGFRSVRWLVPLLLGIGVFASAHAMQMTRDAFAVGGDGLVLMDYRFSLFAVLGWCVLRLRPRYSMPLLSATLFVLVNAIARTAEQAVNPIGLVNLLHIALELGILLMAMLYLRTNSRDARRLTNQLDDETRRDAITGLPNVKALREQVARQASPPGQLACLLLDHTDELTPGFGLHMQARVMGEVAATLQDVAQPFLVGSGQFALLPIEAESERFWPEVVDRVQQAEVEVDGEHFRLLPYLGVASLAGTDAESVDASLLAASQLAFEARGRNELQPLHESGRINAPRQMIDAAGFALDCLRSGRIELYIQPIRRLDGRDTLPSDPLIGEILCRLRDAHGELVTPDRFIKPIESVGRGMELDLAVIRALFTQLRAHPAAAARCGRLAVNLTGQSLTSSSFERQLRALLDEAPLPLSALCFEITETTAIASPFSARELVDHLRGSGCKIAIDDFGTGMQSFARLKEMPVDIIKIDGSFIVNATQRGRDYALVRACVAVARAFDAETVAEFVEDRATADLLQEIGVDWMQGYLYSRPLPLADVLAASSEGCSADPYAAPLDPSSGVLGVNPFAAKQHRP